MSFDMHMTRMVAAIACIFAAGSASADTTPVMVSLVTPAQVPFRSYDVTGFRLSLIYGDCRDFTGFDLGVIQRTAGEFDGFAIGGFNFVCEGLYGGQVGLANWCWDSDSSRAYRSAGAQIGLVNYAESFAGLQYGAVNVANRAFYGLQDGYVNFTGGLLTGMQSGLLNCSADVYGLQSGMYLVLGVNFTGGRVNGCQVGLLNFAASMEFGLQIGIVNIIADNGWFPVLPILNGRF